MANKSPAADSAYAQALARINICRNEREFSLDLRQLGLTTLPPEIGQLTTLTRLVLSGNQLTTLPPVIGQLTALTELDLMNNQLTTLPPAIGKLTALTQLDLRNNKLTTLPPAIGQLTALTELYLMNNQLTTLPPAIGQLTALTQLDLMSNQLTTLPPEIGQLTALTGLDLMSNQLTTLPPAIGKLTALTQLDLSFNDLTTLPPAIGKLMALTELDLSGNQFTTLPPEIGQLTALTELLLHENPTLGIPPEVLGPPSKFVDGRIVELMPAREILEYYFTHRLAAEKEGTEPLLEAKVLVLGEADVGKSCLIAALTEGLTRHQLDGKGTSGIVRKLWPVSVKDGTLAASPKKRGVETLRLNCWDFGGQEIYHSAHTLFLTHRALYLIVISKRDNERQNNVDYWLRMATSFGGPDAVIYLVVNKSDEKVGHSPDEQALRRKYPQLRPFLLTSCEDLTGIPEAREIIVRAALQLEGVRLPVTKSWLAIKKQLEKMKEHTLTLQQWAELCGKKITSAEAQRELLHLCDRLGTVRYFPTNQPEAKKLDAPELCQTTILNPEWITLGIYALFDNEALKKRGGLLSRSEMADILKRRGYPVEQERIIEEVMRRFDLLYDSSDHGAEQRMLIPLMLPEKEPEMEWPQQNTLEFVYQYEVMPAGLVPAFIARAHRDLSKTHRPWRHGCVLEIRQIKVRVMGDAELKRVSISVDGQEALRREALDRVRFTFEALHGAVDKLPVQELIPVPGHTDAPLLDYVFVRSLEWQKKPRFETKGAAFGQTITVEVHEALGSVRGTAQERRDAEQGKIVHVHAGGKYTEKENNAMTENYLNTGDNQGIIGKKNTQTITNSFNRCAEPAAAERALATLKQLLTELQAKLPAEKKVEAELHAEKLEEAVKSEEPKSRAWYSISAKGLLDAAKFARDFSGDLGGTILNLGLAIWPDFQLPL